MSVRICQNCYGDMDVELDGYSAVLCAYCAATPAPVQSHHKLTTRRPGGGQSGGLTGAQAQALIMSPAGRSLDGREAARLIRDRARVHALGELRAGRPAVDVPPAPAAPEITGRYGGRRHVN